MQEQMGLVKGLGEEKRGGQLAGPNRNENFLIILCNGDKSNLFVNL